MSVMRCALLALSLFAVACGSPPKDDSATTIIETETIKDSPELNQDETGRLLRRTDNNVKQHEELRLQGMTQQMVAVHRAIAQSVDDNIDTFRKVALEGDLLLQRNMAVKCLGFAVERREKARDTLLVLLNDDSVTIVANAVRGLGLLRDKETDLTPIVALCGSGDPAIRTNAAATLAALFLIKETPRRLTPQYHAAIDRLVLLLHDESHTRSRRAAAWALANLRHPITLEHLLSALRDPDVQTQIGGLHGLELLGDQRSLDPLLDYLDDAPTTEAASWARQALEKIAIQGGFAKNAAELTELGTNPRLWRKWFRGARMR
ncbi:MAG: HEAT repeat domain-containing protein [Planctomycetota bacterium]|jgi:hypothetical protein